MKDLKAISTTEIMSFLDAISVMDEEVDRAIRITYRTAEFNGIDEIEKEEILDKLKIEMEHIEPTRLKLVKEVTKRFKTYFEVPKGPMEVKKVIDDLVKKYPLLGLSKFEIDKHIKTKAEVDKVKDKQKLKKA